MQYFRALRSDSDLFKYAQQSFPDDTDASGPTVVSTATLETVASWFGLLALDQVRVRFRTNLEIGGVPAFWEDRMVGDDDVETPFSIGSIKLAGVVFIQSRLPCG